MDDVLERLGGSYWEEWGSPTGRGAVTVLAEGPKRTEKEPRCGERCWSVVGGTRWCGVSKDWKVINGQCFGTLVMENFHCSLVINWS